MKKSNWVWMPHPGHFIGSHDCRFHLNTYVGKYLVSTVGEFLPDSEVREIIASCRNIKLKGRGGFRLADYMKKIGYEKLGLNRLYETMVFVASDSKNRCCPWKQKSGSEIYFRGYNTPEEAFTGHLNICKKWAKKGGA